MLMESQEHEPANNGNSPEQHHAMTLDNNLKSGEGTDQESASIPASLPSQPKAFLERNLPGTKDEVNPGGSIVALHFWLQKRRRESLSCNNCVCVFILY